MAEEFEYEYEFVGHIYNNFHELIEAWKDKRWGTSDKQAKSRMLYWYKHDKGLDPKKTKVMFEGTVKPTGRKVRKKK